MKREGNCSHDQFGIQGLGNFFIEQAKPFFTLVCSFIIPEHKDGSEWVQAFPDAFVFFQHRMEAGVKNLICFINGLFRCCRINLYGRRGKSLLGGAGIGCTPGKNFEFL